MKPKPFAESIIPLVTMLFFLQALRVIFSVMFGFIYDQVIEGPLDAWLPVSNLLVLAAVLFPAWVSRKPSWRWMSAAAFVAASARLTLSIDEPWIRYWGSVLIIISAGALFVPLIRLDLRRFLRVLIIAIVLEQLLRLTGHTIDVSLQWAAAPVLAVWIAVLMTLIFWARPWSLSETEPLNGIPWGVGAALGGFLFLETSLLALPNGIARWSGVSYALVAPLLVVITLLPLYPGILPIIRRLMSTMFIRVMVTIIFVGAFLLGYFLRGVLAMTLLLVSQWLLLCALLMLGELDFSGTGKTGGRLALGFLLFLLLNFANAFAFTYAYTLPLMRGLGWVVYLVAGLAVGWGLSTTAEIKVNEVEGEGAFRLALATIVALAVALVSIWPVPMQTMPAGERRFATYNIHYGYDDDWHTTLPEIASTLREARVDVVALQEVDTGRMTSYSTDNAYYLARTLGMNVHYLPNVEHLTGIAVLYKGETLAINERLLPSLQEQTGIIEVVLPWGTEQVHAFGIWMGLSNEDTMRQVKEALAFIGADSPATFGGDFNAQIDDPEMQAVQSAGFVDPFMKLRQVPAPPTSPAIDPQSRIDFIWLKGLAPTRARVSDSLASDHRMVVVEVSSP
mgnify:CR=1 FL=1